MAEFAKRLLKNRTFQALLLLGLGTLLLACLYSFTTLSAPRGQLVDGSTHILGRFGYSLAYGCYWLSGWGAWLALLILLAVGCMLLVRAKFGKWIYLVAVLLALSGLCSMLSLQNVVGAEWLQRHDLPSTGGKYGQLLASMLLSVMPRSAALALSFLCYCIGLAWLLQLRLKQVASVLYEDLKNIGQLLRQGWQQWRDKRAASKTQRSRQQDAAEPQQQLPQAAAGVLVASDQAASQPQVHALPEQSTATLPTHEDDQDHLTQEHDQSTQAPLPAAQAAEIDTQIVIWPDTGKLAGSSSELQQSQQNSTCAEALFARTVKQAIEAQTPTAEASAQLPQQNPQEFDEEPPVATPHEQEPEQALKITVPLQTLANKPTQSAVQQPAPSQHSALTAARTTTALPPATAANTGNGSAYVLPDINMLHFNRNPAPPADPKQLQAVMDTIVKTLQSFGVNVRAGNITSGPSITRYEIYPSEGLRVSRITQLEADLSRATRAEQINILAPIPGKDTVGIEIANPNRTPVELGELLHDAEFTNPKYKIPLALGKDVYGNTLIGDLAAMPHLLVAGATGSGKSVCINSIISSMLLRFSPDDLRFILIDPKVVEMQGYGRLPHLIVPVVTDPKKVIAALRWAVNEMEKRYRCFAKVGVRNFIGYNNYQKKQAEMPATQPGRSSAAAAEAEPPVDCEKVEAIAGALENPSEEEPAMEKPEPSEFFDFEELPDKFPYIVIIIDELADLMQTAPADMESYIARITQKARAAGIHLIVATQTPRAEVVTGVIKANIPSRIAFQVASALDSRVILDQKGAEKLLGKGDCMYLAPGAAKMERAQGAFISDEDVEKLVEFCSNQIPQTFLKDVQQSIEEDDECEFNPQDTLSNSENEIYQKCLEVVRIEKKASASLLQRRLRLGYNKAARMMDMLEENGVVGPQDGAKPREIFLTD